jgi:predicted MPP superfamily phosphohydrolase
VPRALRRGRRARIFVLAFLIAVGTQVPLIAALGHLTGHLAPFVSFSALLTAGFITGLVGPSSVWHEPSRVRLYVVMWPFFTWWTLALLFTLLAPFTFAVRALFHLSTQNALAGGLVLAGLGAWSALRQRARVREVEVPIEGLPPAFDGYRVAHISDLHCGPFASGARVAAWVDHVNRLGADLVAVTGDLIASGAAFVPVVAEALGGLRARDGVFACMGNHDYFTDGETLVAALERASLQVLRNRGVRIARDGDLLYVAGVDDTWTGRDDVTAAVAGRPEGAPVLLLAHDPELFPRAVEHRVDLTLSGHTHGGQLGVPLFARKLNLARLLTPFTTDIYVADASTLYVNRGLGTTGPPVRLAVPPEIAVLTLRRR